MVKKFLDTFDKDEIYDDVVEKKALPELILKQNIINAQDTMLLSERKMMNNFRQSKRFIKQDVIEFEGNIILLFGFIKNMIVDLKIQDIDSEIYDNMLRLERGTEFKPIVLIKFKNFLLKYLHLTNLTNLFMAKGSSFKSNIDNEY